MKMKIRRIIQSLFLLSSLYLAAAFIHYTSKIKAGDMTAVKPGGVEAYLPISAFMSFKQFVMTGNYDWVHPAGLSLFIVFLVVSIVYKRAFCGYICPIGFISEIISKIGLGKGVNKYAAWIMALPKYAVFGFFFYLIAVRMSPSVISMFQKSPYNVVADAKMLNFFIHPSTTASLVINGILVLTLVFYGFWCRFLCPYGVLHSIAGYLSPFAVRRRAADCTDCMQCTNACPMGIEVHKKKTVHHFECIGCHDCVRARSNEKCLYVPLHKKVNNAALIIVSAVIIMIACAMIFGFWNSRISAQIYLYWLDKIDMLTH